MTSMLESDSGEHKEIPLALKKKAEAAASTPAKSAIVSVHNPDDLEEIGRLHMEIEDLRRSMQTNSYVPEVADAVVQAS